MTRTSPLKNIVYPYNIFTNEERVDLYFNYDEIINISEQLFAEFMGWA